MDCIGKRRAAFTGYLDGNGYSIKGLAFAGGSLNGLFAYNYGTIANLTIESLSFYVRDASCVFGGIAAYNYGTIENCNIVQTNYAQVTASHKSASDNSTSKTYNVIWGGICAENNGIINQCSIENFFLGVFENSADCQYVRPFLTVPPYNLWVTSILNVYLGGIAGINNAEILSCTVKKTNTVNVYVSASRTGNYGSAAATTNGYIASVVGYNMGKIQDSKGCILPIIKNIKPGESGSCAANIYDDSVFIGMIAKNEGEVNNLLYF